MNTAAIIIEHVSKTYQRGKVRRGDIRSSMNSWWTGMGKEKEEFDALKDINLTIHHRAQWRGEIHFTETAFSHYLPLKRTNHDPWHPLIYARGRHRISS